jgi:succinoglycan biosynthesis transport protein ExoP
MQPPEFIADEIRRACLELKVRYPGARSIMLTGPVGGEGTTTVSCLCGRVLAEASGGNVVVVDANLRSPGVHRVFSISLKDGLRDWEPELSERNTHRSADFEQLSIIPAGSDNGRSLHMLERSGRLGQLAARLRQEFTYVIWDSPPLNLYPDGRFLLPYIDGVLVVVEGDGTRLDMLTELCEQLTTGTTPVLGVIMNRAGRYSLSSRPVPNRAIRRLPS